MAYDSAMSQFLDIALQAAAISKNLILSKKDLNSGLQIKDNNSVVTDLDKEIESQIRALIKRNFPDHGFYGEETGQESLDAEYVWIIDPIDGTREFTRGLPFFTTLIALMKNEEIILGVSSSPVLDQLLYAELGGGTWLNGKQVHVSERSNLKESFILGSAYKYLSRTNTFESMARLAEVVQGTRNVGGFPGYHWVASGQAEAMIEVDTFIYDVAAFVPIIREAGGVVTDLKGQPITLQSTTLLSSNAFLHKEILSYFSAE
jgi:histidinol-phosphatase